MDSFILRNLIIFCWYRGFCHRTESDLLLFLFLSTLIPSCSVERCSKVPRIRLFQVSLFFSFEFWLCSVIDSFILRNLIIFCWYRGFCHRTESDLLLFLSLYGKLGSASPPMDLTIPPYFYRPSVTYQISNNLPDILTKLISIYSISQANAKQTNILKCKKYCQQLDSKHQPSAYKAGEVTITSRSG